ncbi:MAG: ABC transporter permease, partial [Blastocatellia bacterium]
MLFRQMPFSNPDRLVWIWATHTDRDKAFFSIPDFQDISNQNTTLDAVSGIAGWAANLTGAGEPERLYGLRETANTFGVLGTEAGIGRVLQDADARPDSTPVVVLTYKTWKSRFGADYGLVGRTITLNGDSYTVVGVLTPNFVFPRQPDAEMVAPLKLESDPRRSERGSNFIRAFARLKAGATVAQARIDLAAITGRLRQMYPETNSKYTAPNVLPLFDELVGNYRPALLMLLGAVGVVLLIGCSNLASLLLARASARRSEIAIRTALGADRGRLLRQLLTESLMLALAGGLTGLILAWRSIPLLLAIAPGEMARGQVVHVDGAVLAFALLVSLISAILFGLAPALELSKVDLNEAIKAGNRGSCDSGRSNKARKSLMALEIALSLVLLINAGLLIKGFTRLTAVDPGFKSDHRLIVQLSLPNSRYATAASVKGFYQKLTPRLRAMPGVEDVGLVSVPPLSGLL